MSTPGLETDKDSRRIDWLGADGAPWRPFEEEGVLVQPEERPRDGLTLFAACEERLVKHLGAACLWGEGEVKLHSLSNQDRPLTFFRSGGGYEHGVLQRWVDEDRNQHQPACTCSAGILVASRSTGCETR